MLGDCVRRFILHPSGRDHCHDDQENAIARGLADTPPKIQQVVTQIEQVMTNSGYPAGSYRFVLQSYPAPLPAGSQNRYKETGVKRITQGGCPMWNDDSDWARDSVVPQIADMLKGIAHANNIDFLDVRNLLNGHEVCATSAQQASSANSHSNPQPGAQAEWVRFLTLMQTQGQYQESIHPNYFGQLALGACLTKVYQSSADNKSHACTNLAGQGPQHVALTSAPW